MNMGKRIGKWAWALSSDERLTAALVDAARGDSDGLSAKVRRGHDAMLVKQKKLLALQKRDVGTAARRPGDGWEWTRRTEGNAATTE